MRVKTEEKRQKIIDIAGNLFLESGYEGISMAEISACVGGSKATLYNYFKSKEEIFIAVMLANARKLAEQAYSVLDRKLPIHEKLHQFGLEYLGFILSQEMIELKRTVISQVDKVDMGKHIYDCGIRKAWGRVAEIMENEMKSGNMKKADSWTAATQFKSLLEGDLHTRRLLGVDKRINRKAIPGAVHDALAVFWAYYKR